MLIRELAQETRKGRLYQYISRDIMVESAEKGDNNLRLIMNMGKAVLASDNP